MILSRCLDGDRLELGGAAIARESQHNAGHASVDFESVQVALLQISAYLPFRLICQQQQRHELFAPCACLDAQ